MIAVIILIFRITVIFILLVDVKNINRKLEIICIKK